MDTIQIRAATDADVGGIVDLIRRRIGDEDAPEAQLVLADPSFDRSRWTVAVESGRVVSTMAAFPIAFHYGTVTLAATNFEFVATALSHEGRGLVRRQFDLHHRMAAEHRELIQLIVGIPYFYRRLGYEYPLRVQPLRVLAPEIAVSAPPGWETMQAGESDLDLVLGLQELARKPATVAFALSRRVWRYILASPVYRTIVAVSNGRPSAMGRVYLDDGTPVLMDVAAFDPDALAALVVATRSLAPARPILALSRKSLEPHLASWKTDDYSYGYYVRISDPVEFLNAILPVLTRRLAASSFAGGSGEGLISLYSSSIRCVFSRGTLLPFEVGGPVAAPGAEGGAGVPPDLFCSLVLGGVGVDELTRRHPDFRPGKQRELLETLFPRTSSDVASWVVP